MAAVLNGNHISHPILSSTARVLTKATRVKLNHQALERLAVALSHSELDNAPHHWLSSAPAQTKNYLDRLSLDQQILFFTIFHTIGFCYWGEPKWSVFSPTSDTTYNGAQALLISLSTDANFLSLEYLCQVTEDQLREMLAGFKSVNIESLSLMHERRSLISQLASRLSKDNSFFNVLFSTDQSALAAAFAISEQLPGYLDIAQYQGEPVIFLKKAQLLVTDINYASVRAGKKGFSCMHELTGFADYKLPQLLRHKGVLVYDSDLSLKIDNYQEVEAGGKEEVEIRAATVMAVEFLKRCLAELGILTSAAEIDSKLWLLAQELDRDQVKPYHRCRTVFY